MGYSSKYTILALAAVAIGAAMPTRSPARRQEWGQEYVAISNGTAPTIINPNIPQDNQAPQASPPPAINSPTSYNDIILVTVIPAVIAILGCLGYQYYRNRQRGVVDYPGTEMDRTDDQQPSSSPSSRSVSPPLVEQRGYRNV